MGQALLWITFLAVLVCVYAEAVQKRDVDTRHVENAPPQKKKDVPTMDVKNSPQQKGETDELEDEQEDQDGHPVEEEHDKGETDELEDEQEDQDGHPVEEEHDKEIFERSDEDARAFPWYRGSGWSHAHFLNSRRRSSRRRFGWLDNKHKNKVMNDE